MLRRYYIAAIDHCASVDAFAIFKSDAIGIQFADHLAKAQRPIW